MLTVVTLKHGITRRPLAGDIEADEHASGRLHLTRLADTVAVLCFAVSAGLGVMGLMYQARGATTVTAAASAPDDLALTERVQALEREARPGSDEWRGAWLRVRRLFTD